MSGLSRVRPCGVCGHATRPGRTSVVEFPGTRSRGDKDTCRACYERARRARLRGEADRRGREMARKAAVHLSRVVARHREFVVYPPGAGGYYPWWCRVCRKGGAVFSDYDRAAAVSRHCRQPILDQKVAD